MFEIRSLSGYIVFKALSYPYLIFLRDENVNTLFLGHVISPKKMHIHNRAFDPSNRIDVPVQLSQVHEMFWI